MAWIFVEKGSFDYIHTGGQSLTVYEEGFHSVTQRCHDYAVKNGYALPAEKKHRNKEPEVINGRGKIDGADLVSKKG